MKPHSLNLQTRFRWRRGGPEAPTHTPSLTLFFNFAVTFFTLIYKTDTPLCSKVVPSFFPRNAQKTL